MALRVSMQVIEVCRKTNPRLVVKRARFSALIQADLTRGGHLAFSPCSWSFLPDHRAMTPIGTQS